MDIYDRVAERLNIDDMDVDTASPPPPPTEASIADLPEVQPRPLRFTLEQGYHGFENQHPWPSCVKTLPNGKLLVDFNHWPVSDDMPAIAEGAGVFPFRWANKRIHDELTNEDAVTHMQNWIATQPILTTVQYTPTLYMLFNGVELNHALHEKHQQPRTMLSTDIILFYMQIMFILKTDKDEFGKSLQQKAAVLRNFTRMRDEKLMHLNDLITANSDFKALAQTLLRNPDIEALDATQRQHLREFAELIEMFSVNYIRLLEAAVCNLTPFEDLAADNPKFNVVYQKQLLFKGGLPAEFDEAFRESEFLGNQLAFLKNKFERHEVPWPSEISLSMQQCYRGLNMQACALFLYFIFYEPVKE